MKEVVAVLEAWAPLALQEDYDNCGLQVGDPEMDVDRAMITLDCTEAVVAEAIHRKCGLIISHHPVIFKDLRSITGQSDVERTLLMSIQGQVAIYVMHTNLDNVAHGVNGEIAARLGLKPLHVLVPRTDQLRKLVVFVPRAKATAVRDAMFHAGAGHVGRYAECSFNSEGFGTFMAGPGTHPYVGVPGEQHHEDETRVEVLCPATAEREVLAALRKVHPYEEIAYDLYNLQVPHQEIGSGLVGEWEAPMDELPFLDLLKHVFGTPAVRHSRITGMQIRRVAVCGGSGAFLIAKAMAAKVDAFVTGDVKYHSFFLPEGRMLLADIGHFESERFTMHLMQRRLGEVLPTFATRLTETVTNPIHFH